MCKFLQKKTDIWIENCKGKIKQLAWHGPVKVEMSSDKMEDDFAHRYRKLEAGKDTRHRDVWVDLSKFVYSFEEDVSKHSDVLTVPRTRIFTMQEHLLEAPRASNVSGDESAKPPGEQYAELQMEGYQLFKEMYISFGHDDLLQSEREEDKWLRAAWVRSKGSDLSNLRATATFGDRPETLWIKRKQTIYHRMAKS